MNGSSNISDKLKISFADLAEGSASNSKIIMSKYNLSVLLRISIPLLKALAKKSASSHRNV